MGFHTVELVEYVEVSLDGVTALASTELWEDPGVTTVEDDDWVGQIEGGSEEVAGPMSVRDVDVEVLTDDDDEAELVVEEEEDVADGTLEPEPEVPKGTPALRR